MVKSIIITYIFCMISALIFIYFIYISIICTVYIYNFPLDMSPLKSDPVYCLTLAMSSESISKFTGPNSFEDIARLKMVRYLVRPGSKSFFNLWKLLITGWGTY